MGGGGAFRRGGGLRALTAFCVVVAGAHAVHAKLFLDAGELDALHGAIQDASAQLEAEIRKVENYTIADLAPEDGQEWDDFRKAMGEWQEMNLSRTLDGPLDAKELSPDVQRILLGSHAGGGGGMMGKVLSKIQMPRYRPQKDLYFHKRYTLAAACRFTLKFYGQVPDYVKDLVRCTPPRIRSSFCYKIPINIPVGPLTFNFQFPFCLPDISSFENVLRFLNGDLGAVLSIIG